MSENIIFDSEHKCTSCDGTGYSNINDKSSLCSTCYGSGKLTWTEKIVGKKNPYDLIMMPLTRTFFPNSIASNLVSVQPMEKDVSKICYLNPVFKEDEK